VTVTGISLAFRCFRARVRLGKSYFELHLPSGKATYRYRILLSTDNRSGIEPVYGEPGVDSSM